MAVMGNLVYTVGIDRASLSQAKSQLGEFGRQFSNSMSGAASSTSQFVNASKVLNREALNIRTAFQGGQISAEKFEQGMRELIGAANALRGELLEQMATVEQGTKEWYDLQRQIGETARASRTATSSLDAASGRISRLGLASQVSLGATTLLNDQLFRMSPALGILTGRLTQAAGGFSAFVKSASLVVGTAGVLIALIGGLFKSARAGVALEDAMADVRKTTNLLSVDLDGLVSDFEDMSQELPVSTQELMDIAAVAGQLGIRGVSNIRDFSRTIAELGIATDVVGEEGATQLARFLQATGVAVEDMGSAAQETGNILNQLENNTAATASEILKMTEYTSGLANQANLSRTDILAYNAALLSLGVRAEAGGSALVRVFGDIQTASAEGGEALANYASVAGMTSEEFRTLVRENPADAVQEFARGLNNAKNRGEDLNALLIRLNVNEVRERRAILALAGGYEQLAAARATATLEAQEQNSLAGEVAIRLNTVSSQLKILGNNFKVIFQAGGKFLLPLLTATLGLLNKVVGGFADWVQAMNADPITEFSRDVRAEFEKMQEAESLSDLRELAVNLRDEVGGEEMKTAWDNLIEKIDEGKGSFEELKNEAIEASRETRVAALELELAMLQMQRTALGIQQNRGERVTRQAQAAAFTDQLQGLGLSGARAVASETSGIDIIMDGEVVRPRELMGEDISPLGLNRLEAVNSVLEDIEDIQFSWWNRGEEDDSYFSHLDEQIAGVRRQIELVNAAFDASRLGSGGGTTDDGEPTTTSGDKDPVQKIRDALEEEQRRLDRLLAWEEITVEEHAEAVVKAYQNAIEKTAELDAVPVGMVEEFQQKRQNAKDWLEDYRDNLSDTAKALEAVRQQRLGQERLEGDPYSITQDQVTQIKEDAQDRADAEFEAYSKRMQNLFDIWETTEGNPWVVTPEDVEFAKERGAERAIAEHEAYLAVARELAEDRAELEGDPYAMTEEGAALRSAWARSQEVYESAMVSLRHEAQMSGEEFDELSATQAALGEQIDFLISEGFHPESNWVQLLTVQYARLGEEIARVNQLQAEAARIREFRQGRLGDDTPPTSSYDPEALRARMRQRREVEQRRLGTDEPPTTVMPSGYAERMRVAAEASIAYKDAVQQALQMQKAFGKEVDVVALKKQALRAQIEMLIQGGWDVESEYVQNLIEQYNELGNTLIDKVAANINSVVGIVSSLGKALGDEDMGAYNEELQSMVGNIGDAAAGIADMIPGGQAVAGAIRTITGVVQGLLSVIGDLGNGLAEIQKTVKETAEDSGLLSERLLNVFAEHNTERVSRGGILGWLGFTKAALKEEFEEWVEIAEGVLGGVGSAISSGIQAALSGDQDWADKLRDGLRQAILDAIIQAFIQQAILETYLQDFVAEFVRILKQDGVDAAAAWAGQNVPEVMEKVVDATEVFIDNLPEELMPGGKKPSKTSGSAITEITGETRDLLMDLLRPLSYLPSIFTMWSEIANEAFFPQTTLLQQIADNTAIMANTIDRNGEVNYGGGYAPISARSSVSQIATSGGMNIQIGTLSLKTDARNARQLSSDLSRFLSKEKRGGR